MRFISIILFLCGVLASCKKDETPPAVADTLGNGMVVLCEGLFQQNNSSVSWVNLSDQSVVTSFFEAKTTRSLGDTGNDMQRYGGKIYIVVNVSGTVEVLDAHTFAPVKQIAMTGKQPRSVAFSGNRAFVTCYDGFVDVLDTASLSVVQRIPVGLNPEGLVVSGSKLYVANSGGLNAPLMDSTVSVIDLNTLTETDRITVGLNPGDIEVDGQGDIYVIARGNYGSIPSRMLKITGQNVQSFSFDASGITRMGDKLLVSYYDYGSGQASVGLFNSLTEQMENPAYLDVSGITTLYGVQYDAGSNTIYCFDAVSFTNTGYVNEYTAGGAYVRRFHVGLNPSKLIRYE